MNTKDKESLYLRGSKYVSEGVNYSNLCYWIKQLIALIKKKEEAPLWVPEVYALISLGLGICLLYFAEPIHTLSIRDGYCWILGLAIYKIFETFFFWIQWVFLERTVYCFRRSLIGLFSNILELTIFFAVIFILSGCQAGSWLDIWYDSTMRIITFDSSIPDSGCLFCKWLVMAELVIADFLILTAIAFLGGALPKEEERGKITPDKKMKNLLSEYKSKRGSPYA